MTLVNYTAIEIRENKEALMDLQNYGFLIEPKYFQQGLSSEPKCFLRETVIQKLLNVQKLLKPFSLKIWDAYRSREVQNNIYQKFWKEIQVSHPDWDEETLKRETGKFVSPPYQQNRIPPHATGGTVDLTLVDKNGEDLDMGTAFDDFSPEAQPFYFEIYRNEPKITENRRFLREAMFSEGFTLDEDEWWHFDWGNQMWALKTGASFAIYGEALEDFFKK